MTTRRQCKIQYTVSYHFFLPPVTICLFSPQSYKKKATTTNVMFFFHFTPHGFLYCHVSHNLLFSNISQYLLTCLLIFFSHISRMCYSMAPPGPFPDLTLRFPALSWHFLITFPHHSSSIFLHSFPPHNVIPMPPPRPFPDFTLRLPDLSWHFLITFPHHSSSIFLHSSPPLNIIG